VRTDGDADAANFRTATLSAARLAVFPSEDLDTAIERLFHECARHVEARAVRIRWTVDRLAFGCVDAADCHLIETELLRSLGDDRLHDAVGLHRTWRSLLRPGRSVGQDVDRSPAHRAWLIDQRRRVAAGTMVAHRTIRARVLHQEQIERRDLAVLGESHSGAAGHIRARAADVALFLPADAHHHRRIRLLREHGGNCHRHGACALAAETAAGVFANQDDVRRGDADPARNAGNRGGHTLCGPMEIQLAVLPIRHRAARFHRVVTRGLHDEGFVENVIGLGETAFEIAEGPFLERATHRQTTAAAFVVREIFLGPLHRLERGWRGRCARRRWSRGCPDVPVSASIWPSRTETVQRIDHPWQRREVDVDCFDGRGC
jgi:hypothetical protein